MTRDENTLLANDVPALRLRIWLGVLMLSVLMLGCSPQDHLLATLDTHDAGEGTTIAGPCSGTSCPPLSRGPDGSAVPASVDGSALEELGEWGEPRLLASLSVPGANDQDPTLTADELTIVFTSNRDGTDDLWTATRPSIDAEWPAPTKVVELATDAYDSNPKLSADGLRLWFASDRVSETQSDIWTTSRVDRVSPWRPPTQLSSVNSDTNDICPAPDRMEGILIFSSTRSSASFDFYQATAGADALDWNAPLPLAELNTDVHDWDGVLPGDGTVLYFASSRLGSEDIFVARRTDPFSPFSEPEALEALNTQASEGDPWVSADERHIVYRGDGEDSQDLFEAWR